MADVDTTLADWSTTAGSNKPTDATTIGSAFGDNIRTMQAVIRAYLSHYNAVAVASGGTTDLGANAGLFQEISGTTTITSLGSVSAGIWKIVRFQDALTLTHNATSLILPGAANITTVAGDYMLAYSRGGGNWTVPFYQRIFDPAVPYYSLALAKGDVFIATGANAFAGHTAGNNGTMLMADSTQADGWRAWVPRDHISGLVPTTTLADAANDVTISVGEASDSTGAYLMRLTSALTKRFDATFATGDNNGGMANGESRTANAQLNVWLITKADGTVDVFGNDHTTTAFSPTLPSGFVAKRLIAIIKTSGGGSNYSYIFSEIAGGGIYVQQAGATGIPNILDVTNVDYNGGQLVTVDAAPEGISTCLLINDTHTDSASGHATGWSHPSSLVQPLDVSTGAVPAGSFGGAAERAHGACIRVHTNTVQQVLLVTSTSAGAAVTIDSLAASLQGYEWSRRSQ